MAYNFITILKIFFKYQYIFNKISNKTMIFKINLN